MGYTQIDNYSMDNLSTQIQRLKEIMDLYEYPDDLEAQFRSCDTAICRYAKRHIGTQEECCLQYYYCKVYPTRLWKKNRDGYAEVWVDKNGKYLKSEYRDELDRIYTTYYLYYPKNLHLINYILSIYRRFHYRY